ncbi:winged helix-turn-helix domain-containing protein [Tsuneonella sp. YG55]|uniref:Winged helix-turn-helix domain-containing protein n=1 Tax=Tsuneonella litorea TaxID=2976475 RepID=A0A9X3AK59_9SPHN|nr:winged helix-turn-helix transcriptional regulator [Tsuneonella litorea]MCT2557433.1 winged helix-turn-helix domain-containing protein [Tsuneonella litorea]
MDDVIHLAGVEAHPVERRLVGSRGTAPLQPLVMALLCELARTPNQLVTRRSLFDRLWSPAATVSDDNLNRLVTALRRALDQVGGEGVGIETVPAAGYVLRIAESKHGSDAPDAVADAIEVARNSWRMSLPQPDRATIALCERVAAKRTDAALLGHLAILHRHAAEYAAPDFVSLHVAACDQTARRALALDPAQIEAATALVSVAPLYGRWRAADTQLRAIAAADPGHPLPASDLAVLEMATGQIRAAKARRDALLARDPLCAVHAYKTVYQHWSTGDIAGMDHAADRAIQLYPDHPAIWTARFWTLLYTGKGGAARAMLSPGAPDVIGAAIRPLLEAAVDLVGGDRGARERATALALKMAAAGPAFAVAAMFVLGLAQSVDGAFAVAQAYFLREGDSPVPLAPSADHPRLNEQHRRLTQVLFTPACEAMRADPRFADLCRSIGLADYWEATGRTPDYLKADDPPLP